MTKIYSLLTPKWIKSLTDLQKETTCTFLILTGKTLGDVNCELNRVQFNPNTIWIQVQRGPTLFHLYSTLTLSSKQTPDPLNYVTKWEQDLQLSIDHEHWDQIWVTTKFCSCNMTAIKANYKVLLWWYILPCRLACINPDASPLCFCGWSAWVHLIWWTSIYDSRCTVS